MNIKNENASSPGDADATDLNDPRWLEACRREEAIRELLKRSTGERLKGNDVEDLALELGISRASLYRLIAIYRQTPTVDALQPKQRGRSKGALALDKARHKLIRRTIREVYLKPQRPTLTYLVEQVHLRFAQHGWLLPDRRARLTRCSRQHLAHAPPPADRYALSGATRASPCARSGGAGLLAKRICRLHREFSTRSDRADTKQDRQGADDSLVTQHARAAQEHDHPAPADGRGRDRHLQSVEGRARGEHRRMIHAVTENPA